MKTNIVLIGFMGTGKTAVGKRLAAILNKDFYDTDQEVEKVTGLTIAQLYSRYGEVRFRSEEKLAVQRLAQRDNCIIATGGSVALDAQNIELLAKKGLLICLAARADIIYERVKRRNNRPILLKGDLYENIVNMLAEREGVYQCADYHLDTSDMDFQDIITDILTFLKGYEQKIM